eukprot:COSAG02_NODE_8158_length_2686_cov_2.279474_1_plen_46_part_10
MGAGASGAGVVARAVCRQKETALEVVGERLVRESFEFRMVEDMLNG